MPGQTDNPNLLAAENQEVVALNEVVTAIENLTFPPAQVEVTLSTTGLETSIAALQAALVSTLDQLRVVVKTLNFCCSTTPPTPPEPGTPGGGSPGDPPAPGQEEPPGTVEEKASRRCKMAMWLIDDYLGGVVEFCDKNGTDAWINQAIEMGLAWALPAISALAVSIAVTALALIAIPDPSDALVGLIAFGITFYIVHAVVGEPLDFATLKEFIDNNRVAMICALNNSQNAYSAHFALVAAIDDISPGLSAGNRTFVRGFLGMDSLALLFFVDERFGVLETWISEQPDTCPCADVPPETGTPTNVYKCKAANYLFDNFVDSLSNWGSIATMTWYTTPNFISALTGGLLVSLMGPLYAVAIVGWNMLARIVSFLGTIFWHGTGYFEAFELIAAEFEERKSFIICDLYLAEDVDTARTELENRINDYVGSVMTAHPEWADQMETYKDAIKDLLPNSALNVLFETTPRPEIINYAPEDYYECECGGGDPCLHEFSFASGSEGWEAFINNGGSVQWSIGQLGFSTPVNPPQNGYCGWKYVFSDKPVISNGDYIQATHTVFSSGQTSVYLHIHLNNYQNTLFIELPGSTVDLLPHVLELQLSSYVGQTIDEVLIYEDTIFYAHSGKWDNVVFRLCDDWQ